MTILRRLAAAVLACGLLAAVAACGSGGGSTDTIRVGTVPALLWAGWTATPDAMSDADSNTKVELVTFRSSADVFVALQTGDIQMATMGMNVAATGLEKNDVPVTMVAGVSPGRSQLLVRGGSGIAGWSDMRGRRIGIIRGSTDELIFRIALAHNGIDMDKDTQVTTMQAPADLLLALRNGDVDAVVTYQPNTAQAESQGVASAPPALNAQLIEWASVPTDVWARDELIAQRPDAVQDIVNSYVGVTRTFTDKETWVDTAMKYQSGDPVLLAKALENSEPWWRMDATAHRDMVANMQRFGALQTDVGQKLVDRIDYSFLTKATGQTPEQLGASQGGGA
jgi:sulfonate transport system substrate-binding protein